MTSEQIAELRFNAGHLVKFPLLVRLIAEREALLEACRTAMEMQKWETDQAEETWLLLKEVIDKVCKP